MNNWFECKISYEKTMEDGALRKVTEAYLVDALSFTEAEARITEEAQAFISGEFKVEDIKRARLSETFFGDGEKYYKAKVNYITLDARSGREKRTPVYMLVQALTLEDARTRLDEGMKGTLADYIVESLAETKLLDVFTYGKEAAHE